MKIHWHKRLFEIVMVALACFGLIPIGWAWTDPGDPIPCKILVSLDSVSWTHSTLTACPCAKVYMRAVDNSDNDVTNIEIDTLGGINQEDSAAYLWAYGEPSPPVIANKTSHTYCNIGSYYICLTADDGGYPYDDPIARDSVLIQVINDLCPKLDDTTHWKCASNILPDWGNFSAGTAGWTLITTGGSSVISYNGYIGLRVPPTTDGTARVAKIQTWDLSTSTYLDFSNHIKDQVRVCVYFQGSPSYGYKLKGDLICTAIWGGYTTQPLAQAAGFAIDTLGNPTGGVELGIDSSFTKFHYDFQFTPIHPDFFRITNLQLYYRVPGSFASETTEIQIDRIRINVYRNP